MSRKFFFGLTLAFLLAFVSSPKLRAQELNVAQVTGQVVDSSGAVVPGGTVKLIETDKGVAHTATTDASGNYILPGLPPGPYRLEVDKTGFKTYVQTGIVLQVSDHVTLNATLEVGAASETVEVSATGPLVQTETAAISTVMESERITDLPIPDRRNVTDLITFQGAAVHNTASNDETGSKNFNSSVMISVAGGQANATNYLLDGGDYNDTFSNVNLPLPFPEALQEFSVETSALPARNGLHPGGVVNEVTKSGTNQMHGDGFLFNQDGPFNAIGRSFETPQYKAIAPPTQDKLVRNTFGGDMGGKLITDRLFWFAGYQGFRQHNVSENVSEHTITSTALSGDFTGLESPACTSAASERTLKGPFNGGDKTSDAGVNKVSASFDPVAAAVFVGGYMPVIQDSPAAYSCGLLTFNFPEQQHEDQIIGRMDFIKSDKQSVYGRYLVDDARIPGDFNINQISWSSRTPGGNPSPANNFERVQAAAVGYTYTFTPTFINALHATFNYRRDNRASPSQEINWTTLATLADKPVAQGGLGANVPLTNFTTPVPNFLLFNISGFFNVGCGTCNNGFFNISTGQVADDVDWIRGAHHFAFGVDFIHTINNTLTGYDNNGTFAFTGGTADPVGAVNGDGMPDFMVGSYFNNGGSTSFTQSHAQAVAYHENIPSLYFQDTYKVRHNLTVEAGLRWEPTIQPYDQFYRGSSFNMADFLNNIHTSVFTSGVSCPGSATVPCPPAGMLYHGDPGIPAGYADNHLANFAPRIGVAWDPTGHGTQSIRAGYGILYDSTMVWYSQRLTSNPPYVDQVDVPNSCGTFSNPWLNYPACAGGTGTGVNPFAGSNLVFPPATAWANLLPNPRPMYMEEWNVSYEREFAHQWVASVAYLGNHAMHTTLSYDGNYIMDDPAVCAEFGAGGCTSKNESTRRFLYQAERGCLASNGFSGCTASVPTAAEPASYGSGVGTIYQSMDTGHSVYKGLFAKLEHRFGYGVVANANYTYSKCESLGDFNGDLRGTYFNNNELGTANVFNSDYGYCNYDIRHLFNLTMAANSPIKGGGFRKWILGGWQFAPDIHYQSGWPIDVGLGDILATGYGSRAELTGNPIYADYNGHPQYVCTNQGTPAPLTSKICETTAILYINTGSSFVDQNLNALPVASAAFANPTSATAPFPVNAKAGNAYNYIGVPRDFLRNPGMLNIDAQISRQFPVGERLRLEARFQAFNAINHVNLQYTGMGNGVNPVSGKNLGLLGGTSTGQRVLQFVLMLHF